MVTKDNAKEYLRIPYDEDDSFIEQIIQGGYDYLAAAVDDFEKLQTVDEFSRKVDLWVLTQWVPKMFDEREGMQSGAPELNYAARALLTQLQMYEYKEENP